MTCDRPNQIKRMFISYIFRAESSGEDNRLPHWAFTQLVQNVSHLSGGGAVKEATNEREIRRDGDREHVSEGVVDEVHESLSVDETERRGYTGSDMGVELEGLGRDSSFGHASIPKTFLQIEEYGSGEVDGRGLNPSFPSETDSSWRRVSDFG